MSLVLSKNVTQNFIIDNRKLLSFNFFDFNKVEMSSTIRNIWSSTNFGLPHLWLKSLNKIKRSSSCSQQRLCRSSWFIIRSLILIALLVHNYWIRADLARILNIILWEIISSFIYLIFSQLQFFFNLFISILLLKVTVLTFNQWILILPPFWLNSLWDNFIYDIDKRKFT